MSFVPIQFGDYVRLFLKSNRGETAKEVSARLRSALEAYKAGKRCCCGEPIWVIGSAEAGHACFTCITGEAYPSEDYEIAEACDKTCAPHTLPDPDASLDSVLLDSGRDDHDVPFQTRNAPPEVRTTSSGSL